VLEVFFDVLLLIITCQEWCFGWYGDNRRITIDVESIKC